MMSTDRLVTAATSTDRVDADALVAELFATEGRSLVRLACIFCDDQAAAEDLVQEAFIRLHRSAASIRDVDRAPAFLRSVLINLARDHNRRGLMSLRHGATLRHREATRQAVAEPPGTADDQRVLDAIRLLPDRQRACIVLRYYLQYSESEIADTLGISGNSVKTHCRRALAGLESALKESP